LTVSSWAWYVANVVPGGDVSITVILNSLVHVVMYSYYLMSTIVTNRSGLWWGIYLTQMQMIQFVLYIAMCVGGFVTPSNAPKTMYIVSLAYNVSLFLLFSLFYFRKHYQVKISQSH
jgi:elongation of very long chain fatty acids protein 4